MGFLRFLGWGATPSVSRPLAVASWTGGENNLLPIVVSDIFGDDVDLPLTRAEALTVPACAAAQQTLVASFGNLGLVADRNGAPLASQPRWLTNTGKADQPTYLRNARTIVDFLFLGFSLWGRANGSDGFPTAAWHVPFGRWTFDDNDVILIDNEPVDETEIIFFESMVPGLLNVASRTIRTAVEIEKTISERAKVSVPTTLVKNTTTDELTQEEVDRLLEQYRKARASSDGSTVAYVPSGIDVEILADPQEQWLLEARNAVVTDVAKHTGIPSSQLEGTSSIDSLTYATEQGQNARLLQQTARLYLDPIEARLSMSDLTPNGQSVRFETQQLDQMLADTAPAANTNPEVPSGTEAQAAV
jgi:hypothetical protein